MLKPLISTLDFIAFIFVWIQSRIFSTLEAAVSLFERLSVLQRQIICAIAIALALSIRYWAIPVTAADTFGALLPWLGYADLYGFAAVGVAFTNYTPFYQYLLILATRIVDPSTLYLNGLPIIKYITYSFEVINAFWIYQLAIAITKKSKYGWLAATGYLLLPTVIWNSAFWGQADALWTCFLLGSMYCLLQKRNLLGTLFFGVAISIKAQAIFFGPFILGIWLKRRVPFWYVFCVPAMYIVIGLPALLGGYEFLNLMSVYLVQGKWFDRLNMNAADLWYFIPNEFYTAGTMIGITAAAIVGIGLAVVMYRSRAVANVTVDLYFATLSLGLMPFILPKMHERYFHGMEVFILLLAISNRRYLRYVFTTQLAVSLSYLPYQIFSNSEIWFAASMPLAAILMTLNLAMLLLDPPVELVTEATKQKLGLFRSSIENFMAVFCGIYLLWCGVILSTYALISKQIFLFGYSEPELFPWRNDPGSGVTFAAIVIGFSLATRKVIFPAREMQDPSLG